MPEIGQMKNVKKKNKKKQKTIKISGSCSTKLQNMIHVSSNTNGLQHSVHWSTGFAVVATL